MSLLNNLKVAFQTIKLKVKHKGDGDEQHLYKPVLEEFIKENLENLRTVCNEDNELKEAFSKISQPLPTKETMIHSWIERRNPKS